MSGLTKEVALKLERKLRADIEAAEQLRLSGIADIKAAEGRLREMVEAKRVEVTQMMEAQTRNLLDYVHYGEAKLRAEWRPFARMGFLGRLRWLVFGVVPPADQVPQALFQSQPGVDKT